MSTETNNTPQAIANLDWPQKLQMINHFKVDEDTASKVFGVSKTELQQVMSTTSPDSSFNANPYATHFKVGKPSSSTATKTGRPRGRPSSKIADAFNAVTHEAVPLDEFCQTHGVSTHCMSQRKRFDRENKHPDVVVRKVDGVRKIWRETETEQASNGQDQQSAEQA